MNDQTNGAANANDQTTNESSAEHRSTYTLDTIGRLIEVIPESELRLRDQLSAVVDSLDDEGDTIGTQRTRWRRAVQFFGNRVYELKERGGDAPEWVNAGTQIIDEYTPEEDRADAVAIAIASNDTSEDH